jgi:hypothetical protein
MGLVVKAIKKIATNQCVGTGSYFLFRDLYEDEGGGRVSVDVTSPIRYEVDRVGGVYPPDDVLVAKYRLVSGHTCTDYR